MTLTLAPVDHPHDGYAYDGCLCAHCVDIRAGSIDHWLGHPDSAYQRDVREDENWLGHELGGEA